MTKEESKAAIINSLQQNSINLLVDKLAEVGVENEQLKARVSELEAATKSGPGN